MCGWRESPPLCLKGPKNRTGINGPVCWHVLGSLGMNLMPPLPDMIVLHRELGVGCHITGTGEMQLEQAPEEATPFIQHRVLLVHRGPPSAPDVGVRECSISGIDAGR